MTDYSQREVGWLVTKEHQPPMHESRIGWGQLRVHASETEDSFERVFKRTIFMDKSLTEHMIPEEFGVRWRSFDDDMNACYDGLVRADWIFNQSDDELAYNIDRFNYTDVGAIHVYYSVRDIISCARKLSEPKWEKFARSHTRSDISNEDHGAWIEIFG